MARLLKFQPPMMNSLGVTALSIGAEYIFLFETAVPVAKAL